MTYNIDINVLIKLRIEQASETVIEAEDMINLSHYRAAMNRIYYAMFYMLLALAVKYKFKTSKHAQLIGWFNKTFIKEEILDKKYGSIIHRAFDERTISDYGAFSQYDKEVVDKRFTDMKDFIHEINILLNE